MKNRIILAGSVIIMALVIAIALVGCDGLFGNNNPIKIPTKAELVGFQTEFDLDDDFSLGGGVVTVTYSNGSVISYTEANLDEINLIVDSSGFDSSKVDEYTITVKSTKYKQINETYKVHVIDPDETVRMPIASPYGGAYVAGNSVEVELSCRTEGAEIWYTLNENTPTNAAPSLLYVEGTPLVFTETTILWAKAFTVDGKTPSATLKTGFSFDLPPDEE